MIVDANNAVLGRLGTYVAKKALLGEKVEIVNCENSVITGQKEKIFSKYRQVNQRGIPSKGPFFYKSPDRFVKRSIRGMLPYKKDRGRTAFKNIKCHIGVPEHLKKEKFEEVKSANADKLPNLYYVKVKEVCSHLGAKAK